MKAKNLSLGVAATMFAVAGVAASSSMIIANYVQVPTGPLGSIQCRLIDPIECGSNGPHICRAYVTGVVGGPYDLYQTRTSSTTCAAKITTSPFILLDNDAVLSNPAAAVKYPRN